MIEHDDRRILGALELLDGTTGLRVQRPLVVEAEAEATRVIRNRGNQYVILDAPGLHSHTERFDEPPATPPIASLEAVFEIRDPAGQFLPARTAVRLPRDPSLENVLEADSLFQPRRVALVLSPSASTSPSWALVRVSVADTAGQPLGGALIRVVRSSDDERVGIGLSEWRARHGRVGEALVAIPGVPVTTFGEGEPGEPVLVNEIAARVEVAVAPDLDISAGAVPDAEELELRLAAQRAGEAPADGPALRIGSQPLRLAAGRSQHIVLSVDLS